MPSPAPKLKPRLVGDEPEGCQDARLSIALLLVVATGGLPRSGLRSRPLLGG